MARILVVQENADNVLDLQNSLLPAGHILLIAVTIQDAMSLLAVETFDLIICAVHLRRGSVFDLLKFVKNTPRHRCMPFVFFCNNPGLVAQYVSETVEATAVILGADKFITTCDFNAEEFRRQIEVLLSRKQAAGDEQAQSIVRLRTRANQALEGMRFREAEEILKELLEKMRGDRARYQPLDVATVRHDLAKILERQGKLEEASQFRMMIEDF